MISSNQIALCVDTSLTKSEREKIRNQSLSILNCERDCEFFFFFFRPHQKKKRIEEEEEAAACSMIRLYEISLQVCPLSDKFELGMLGELDWIHPI